MFSPHPQDLKTITEASILNDTCARIYGFIHIMSYILHLSVSHYQLKVIDVSFREPRTLRPNHLWIGPPPARQATKDISLIKKLWWLFWLDSEFTTRTENGQFITCLVKKRVWTASFGCLGEHTRQQGASGVECCIKPSPPF